MDQFQALLDAIGDLKCDIGIVKNEVTHVKDHLARLNGSVARHEKSIQEQVVLCAERKALGDQFADVVTRVDELERIQTAETAAVKVNSDWREALKPILIGGVCAVLSAIATLVLMHAPAFATK